MVMIMIKMVIVMMNMFITLRAKEWRPRNEDRRMRTGGQCQGPRKTKTCRIYLKFFVLQTQEYFKLTTLLHQCKHFLEFQATSPWFSRYYQINFFQGNMRGSSFYTWLVENVVLDKIKFPESNASKLNTRNDNSMETEICLTSGFCPVFFTKHQQNFFWH